MEKQGGRHGRHETEQRLIAEIQEGALTEQVLKMLTAPWQFPGYVPEAFSPLWKPPGFGYPTARVAFSELFMEWMLYKNEAVGTEKGQLSPSTIRRYSNDYRRFFKDSWFERLTIPEISSTRIEKFLKETVVRHAIERKCLNNIFGYIKGAFFYGNKSGLTDLNPCALVDLKPIRGFCTERKKSDRDKTLSDREVRLLKGAVAKAIKKNPEYMADYAIELSLLTGMRVGEIAALKWECIHDGYIFIDYSEHRLDYMDRPSELVIGEPKNNKHRVFPVTEEIEELFDRVRTVQERCRADSEYVFANAEKRFKASEIGFALARRCKSAGIPGKSIHDIRRTVSSKLRLRMPSATVAALMGHLEETNEQYYNKDIMDTEEKRAVLCNLFGKKRKRRAVGGQQEGQ